MAHWVEVLVTKFVHPRLIFRTPAMKGEHQLPQLSSHAHEHWGPPPPTHKNLEISYAMALSPVEAIIFSILSFIFPFLQHGAHF